MSKEAENEFLAGLVDQQEGVQDEVKQPDANEDNQDQGGEPELDLSPMEQKAYDQGWRPQDDFSGPEDSWKTAKEYVNDGKWLAKIKESNQRVDKIEADFNERLENSNKLNEVRRKAEIAELKKQQRDAVGMSDEDAYDNAQVKIEQLESEKVDTKPVVTNQDPDIASWEAANPWINDLNDERTTVAQGIYNNYAQQNKGATPAQALAHLDGRLSKLYPKDKSNPRREQPNTTETARKSPQRKNRELTMSDLTQAEQSEYAMYGQSMFKTEKAFLKAVKDARVK